MKTKIIIILSLISCCIACQDDFLDLAPVSERNVQDFYQTADDFNNAVLGAYATLKEGGIYGNSMIWMGEVMSDNAGYGVTRNPVNVYSFEFIDHIFTGLNSIIYAAWQDHYQGIARTNAILDKIEGIELSEEQKNQYQGEAQFLRALFYFNLVRIFGDIPLITSEITSPFEGNELVRNPASDVYTLIMDDLSAAETLLPVSYPGSQAGRATQGAAKALLGKVHLTLGNHEQAASKLKEVIDMNQYMLLDDYSQVFAYDNPNNAEIIFDVQYKSGQIGQGSSFWSGMAPWQSGEAVLGPDGGGGGGLSQPTTDMINAYEAGDARKLASLDMGYYTLDSVFVPDPYVVKYRHYGALPGDADTDFPVIRYADVLLMYAEALNEQNNTSAALPYLNAVRNRAGLEGLNISSQTEMRRALEQERRVELAFENHRWFDLVRTGRYVEVMSAKGYAVEEYHRYFVIPQREIDLNQNLEQNPGY